MNRKIKILACILLAQTVCLTSNALRAEDNKDSNSLSQLISPLTVQAGPVTGSGKDRDAEIAVKNDSGRSISGFIVDMLLLRSDGTVTNSVLHNQCGFSGHDKNTLDNGESYTFKVGNIFIKGDVTAVDAVVTKITFSDNSTWPSMPSPPPERKNGETVAVKMIGVLGAGEKAVPVVALFNYGPKAVHGVHYNLEYLDSLGKVLKKTNYGSEAAFGKSLMESSAGMVVSGGHAPPEKTASVRLSISSITFTDGTEWKQGM